MPAGRSRKLPVGPLLLAALAGLPILSLAFAAILAMGDGASGLSARMLPIALADTGWLMVLVGAGTAIIGLGTAWLTSHFSFFGRRAFDWLLVLPLAVPTYLSAYTWVEFLEFTGPIQTLIRTLTGASTVRDYWFPPIRTTSGAAFVMILVLFPYVYLSCRAFFLMQSGAMDSAARTLGASAWRSFFAITLPLSRPAIVVGVTLALMEVANDLGAVQYFGVNSLTAIIYATWLNRGSFGGAAQLAVMTVLIIGLLISLEQRARRANAHLGNRDSRTPPPRMPLSGWRAGLAFTACALPVALGFGVPAGELLALASKRLGPNMLPPGFWPAFSHSLLLATGGALLCLILGYYSAWRAETGPSRVGSMAIRFATLGYAMPGAVLALGLVAPLGLADAYINTASRQMLGFAPGLILSGSFIALLYAYSIRFLAISHTSLEAGRARRGPNVISAAQVLGARGWRLLFRIDLPTLTPAVLAAATLVFVECIKELPATLLLRPLGVETLSTLVFQQANAELFEKAALPALAIIGAGVVPVILANHYSAKNRAR